jgi:DNA processing protein
MDELSCWLVLHRAPGLGSRGLAALLARFPSPCAVLDAGAGELGAAGLGAETLAYLRAPDHAGVEADLAWRERPGCHILTVRDPRYPARLRCTADPPQVLYVLGDPEVLAQPQLAIVGSRHPTPGGAETAFEFARDLAAAGLVITSGLALGIDGAAHRGALGARGLTVAVAGNGLDRVYPARHRDLAHRIAAEGALVSEFWPGTPPMPDHFPRRNRIIAGLALGTLVVEAALRSGSLITARLAAEEGREVFAVPGSVRNPVARGCHALIRQGAALVETPADVLQDIARVLPATPAPVVPGPAAIAPELDPEHRRLLACMGYDPVSVDSLVERSGLTAEAVSSILMMLELRGLVEAHGGGCYARATLGT